MDASPNGPGLAAMLLTRTLPLALIVVLAVAHGAMLSPLYDFVSYFVSSFSRRTVFYHPLLLENLPSALIAVLTLLAGGVPAAIYERLRGMRDSTPMSMAIWLGTTVVITAPVLSRALALR